MAAGLAPHLAGDRVEVRSGRFRTRRRINPVAVEAMAEVGIDITDEKPPSLDRRNRPDVDVVITMGCGDACPFFPASATRTGSSTTRPDRVSRRSARYATRSKERVEALRTRHSSRTTRHGTEPPPARPDVRSLRGSNARIPRCRATRTLPRRRDMVQFGILGPLEVLVDGEPVALGGPRQRAVLVRLLFDAGRVVSSERIIDDVWDGRPPPSAAKTLQKYVSELRKLLPDLTLRTSVAATCSTSTATPWTRTASSGWSPTGRTPARWRLWRGAVLSDLPDLAFVAPGAGAARRAAPVRHRVAPRRRTRSGASWPGARRAHRARGSAPAARAVDLSPDARALPQWTSGRGPARVRAPPPAPRRRDRRRARPADCASSRHAILRHDPASTAPPRRGRASTARQPPDGADVLRRTRLDGARQRSAGVAEHRLVTFTGSRRSGQERLAMELGAASSTAFLAAYGPSISRVSAARTSYDVGVGAGHRRAPRSRRPVPVVAALAHRPACLIVLDNCEHLVEPLAALDRRRCCAPGRRPRDRHQPPPARCRRRVRPPCAPTRRRPTRRSFSPTAPGSTGVGDVR